MTPGGLPVGLEIDGPLGTDTKLLGLGFSIEAILGTARAEGVEEATGAPSTHVIARSPCDEAIQLSIAERSWIASLRSQ